jgi:MFS family permease
MRLPAALVPLRHPTFRALWLANLVASLGTWMQNTGAGWLMTSLDPNALIVSLVQAATIMPVFLLALPAGALADILDRRRFLIATQGWMLVAAAALAALTLAHMIGAWGLLAFTFAIGMGTAMNGPAWGAVIPEVVPREDFVQAIALGGIAFNIARAIGPALAGFVVLWGGAGLTFTLNAVSFLCVIGVLVFWRRREARHALPPEHLLSAIRAGMRFARHTPAMRAAVIRGIAYFLPAAAPWAMLPLIVRDQLHLGAGSYGLLLGLMGIGGVASGLLLPAMRRAAGRGKIVWASSLVTSAGMGLLAVSHHWAPAAIGMLLFGIGWVAAGSTTQAAAQIVAPPWVRARALALYQLAVNGALACGSFVWGGLATRTGLEWSLGAAAICGLALVLLTLPFGLDQEGTVVARPPPTPDISAPEIGRMLRRARGRVLETMRYRVDPAERDAFLAVMAEVRHVRGRSGAIMWQLYEEVAQPNGWLELWAMESWTDHLRERSRLSEDDKDVLSRLHAWRAEELPAPSRYIAVEPRNAA